MPRNTQLDQFQGSNRQRGGFWGSVGRGIQNAGRFVGRQVRNSPIGHLAHGEFRQALQSTPVYRLGSGIAGLFRGDGPGFAQAQPQSWYDHSHASLPTDFRQDIGRLPAFGSNAPASDLPPLPDQQTSDRQGFELPPVPAQQSGGRQIIINPMLLPAAGILGMPGAVGTTYQGGGTGRMNMISNLWGPSRGLGEAFIQER